MNKNKERSEVDRAEGDVGVNGLEAKSKQPNREGAVTRNWHGLRLVQFVAGSRSNCAGKLRAIIGQLGVDGGRPPEGQR